MRRRQGHYHGFSVMFIVDIEFQRLTLRTQASKELREAWPSGLALLLQSDESSLSGRRASHLVGRAGGGVVGVEDEGVGSRDDALHEDGHAQVPEVQAHLAHRQQRALVELARPHALHGSRGRVIAEPGTHGMLH